MSKLKSLSVWTISRIIGDIVCDLYSVWLSFCLTFFACQITKKNRTKDTAIKFIGFWKERKETNAFIGRYIFSICWLIVYLFSKDSHPFTQPSINMILHFVSHLTTGQNVVFRITNSLPGPRPFTDLDRLLLLSLFLTLSLSLAENVCRILLGFYYTLTYL